MNKIILASKSPRRFDLLSDAGFQIKVMPADIDEAVQENETPKELVLRLAYEKAKFIAKKEEKEFVVGSDTIVSVNDKILGKPKDKVDAKKMLLELNDNTHSVLSGISIINLDKEIEEKHVSETFVKFRKLNEAEIDNYLKTDEPYDKAGSYAIQGLAANFVESIQGSYTNVVGIDVAYVCSFFREIS